MSNEEILDLIDEDLEKARELLEWRAEDRETLWQIHRRIMSAATLLQNLLEKEGE